MAASAALDLAAIEARWLEAWSKSDLFSSTPDDREPYTVVIPPPNVTGVLHMGHTLNNTIQDALVRRARKMGKNACWVPGIDHASIATENKVVAMLAERGIDKNTLSREQFLEYAWEWKNKYGGIILEQLRRLGASADWKRTTFTMDAQYSQSVIHVFIDLYRKGYIYRGTRMVNWDPTAKTALSDEEVVYKETESALYELKYQIEGTSEYVHIATTRPETIFADTAVCMNPTDGRYLHLKGKRVIIPLTDKAIPVIYDDYVDKEFGTGVLKVTPAHDINDFNIGVRHKLPVVDILNEDGTLNQHGRQYAGMDRFKVRRQIVKDLEAAGLLTGEKKITNNVGYSERSNAVVEPRLSLQWFCKMDKMAAPALQAVESNAVAIIPERLKNTYRHWMTNIQDWCVSRQLWWGHRIPAWYSGEGYFVVAETAEEAVTEFKKEHGIDVGPLDIRQDEDVLDTWFSSWLWPMGVFNGILAPDNRDFKYYYPTSALVTGPDIIFFWVARMIMAGFEYTGKKPFDLVYFTGIVRDKLGRKMSKQLGNSPDMLELIHKYGADGVRFGVLVSAPAGNDLLFDEKLCEQGRNFCNKLYNAARLVLQWKDRLDEDLPTAPALPHVHRWFEEQLASQQQEMEGHWATMRMSEGVMTCYKLAWDDFCSWYLELVKPAQGLRLSQEEYDHVANYFKAILDMLHPFMPFITEELYHQLNEDAGQPFCATSPFIKASAGEPSRAGQAVDLIARIRSYRSQQQMGFKEPLTVFAKTQDSIYTEWQAEIKKLANAALEPLVDANGNYHSFAIKSDEFYIPMPEVQDKAGELDKVKQEIQYTEGFLKAVQAKLANERFVQNAKPELVEKERQKKADAEASLNLLRERLKQLQS